jgi:hypothetical protein
LVVLTIQLVDITKGKEKWEQIWCTKCRTEGHHKDECPTFAEYMAAEAPNPLPRGGYCEICNKWGHNLHDFPLLQKYQSTSRNLFYAFCKSVGNEDKYCFTFDLMRENTSDMYIIQEENVVTQNEVNIIIKEALTKETEEDFTEVEVDQISEEGRSLATNPTNLGIMLQPATKSFYPSTTSRPIRS